jgi:hypothetical protein
LPSCSRSREPSDGRSASPSTSSFGTSGRTSCAPTSARAWERAYEFRVDQDAEQILRKAGKDPKREPERGKILLRVFFHPHGNKLLLLLSGYDKAEHSSKPHQNAEIEEARRLLRYWKERQKKRR